jgi:hypothetical protein
VAYENLIWFRWREYHEPHAGQALKAKLLHLPQLFKQLELAAKLAAAKEPK